MKNEFEEYDYEYDTAVDALLAFLNFLPKDTVKMIDFDRFWWYHIVTDKENVKNAQALKM